MQDILLDFTHVPSLGNERRIVEDFWYNGIYSTIVSYCLRCKRKTPKLNPTFMRTKNSRILLRTTCPVCGTNKSSFMSSKETNCCGLGIINTAHRTDTQRDIW